METYYQYLQIAYTLAMLGMAFIIYRQITQLKFLTSIVVRLVGTSSSTVNTLKTVCDIFALQRRLTTKQARTNESLNALVSQANTELDKLIVDQHNHDNNPNLYGPSK